MPESARIFAPVSDELLAHMIRLPLIGEHLFELSDSREARFELPPLGLLVVRVPDEWWWSDRAVRELGPGVLEIGIARDPGKSCWPPSSSHACPAFPDDVEIRKRFPWIADVSPPPALLNSLRASAEETGAPLAYYHWREHGDDLYYEFAFLFGGHAEASVVIRQTFLVDTDDNEECVWLAPEGRLTSAGAVFPVVLEHIGSPSRIQYFPPDEESGFNWEICRVDAKDCIS